MHLKPLAPLAKVTQFLSWNMVMWGIKPFVTFQLRAYCRDLAFFTTLVQNCDQFYPFPKYTPKTHILGLFLVFWQTTGSHNSGLSQLILLVKKSRKNPKNTIKSSEFYLINGKN